MSLVCGDCAVWLLKVNTTSANSAAGKAMRIFSLNLSRIWQPCERVAAMVVSEMIERLSPNMAPLSTTPAVKPRFKSAAWAIPNATGAIAAIVPIEVPIAVATKAEMTNSPGRMRLAGSSAKPRFTVASTPPVALATAAKAPASR